jgi:hypothetical protein
MQVARRGDVPVFNPFPGPGPLPGGDLLCGSATAHLTLAPRYQAPDLRAAVCQEHRDEQNYKTHDRDDRRDDDPPRCAE